MQNPNIPGNSMNQPLGPNPQILNNPGQPPSQQGPQNDFGTAKQAGRQYYSPYQGQYGYGSVQGLNYPYAGAGVGSYQYGTGQCKNI
jgi:large exoprotein involved in heme utilization and adhesion